MRASSPSAVLSLCLLPCVCFGVALTDAQIAADEGRYSDAVASYRLLLNQPMDQSTRLSALWGLADVYREQGKNRAALESLDAAALLATSPETQVLTDLRRGGVLYGLGRYEEAAALLKPLRSQDAVLDPPARIGLLLDLGNVAVETDELREAVDYYDEAAQVAKVAASPALEARARINAVRAQLDAKDLREVEPRLEAIKALLPKCPEGRVRAELYVGLGNLYGRAINEFDFPRHWRGDALAAFQEALSASTDAATRGYAYGFMGALYEDEGRLNDALSLSRKALFQAQQASLEEQVYRWEWQIGRILRAQGQLESADSAYERATFTLNKVKPNFAAGSRNTFKQLVAPVYTQYADVMLSRATAMPSGEQKQHLLRQVRDLLETLKQAEVEDYFANACVVRNQLDGMRSLTDGDAAVIYPVFLDQRLEVLIEAGNELVQFTAPVGINQATQTIRRFRLNLERSTAGDAFLPDAQQLYQWLIAPGEVFLSAHGVKTLVIVPEGALRTVPLSALNDGKQFLVERFAIATTPAIKLTQQLQNPRLQSLLIGGVSEGVQGFAELPSVNAEIDTVSGIYPGLTMRDAAFQTNAVTLELESSHFSLAHFATHGEFNQDYRKSFILTYDDKLTLNGLQHALALRGRDSLDLLVLSACKTAAGDDRAALGLAGVAVQSGANSVLASLWSISDPATAQLISSFYTKLKQPDHTKAESLREAQIELLHGERFNHPSYWAPYLLIGNWL